MHGVPLFVGEEGSSIANQEAHGLRVGLIDIREIDLVECPVTNRVPDATTGRGGSPYKGLRSGRPGRLSSGFSMRFADLFGTGSIVFLNSLIHQALF